MRLGCSACLSTWNLSLLPNGDPVHECHALTIRRIRAAKFDRDEIQQSADLISGYRAPVMRPRLHHRITD
jgi:hypothetical protein